VKNPSTPPNSEQLRTFLVFAEHLNFVRSAEVLRLSQPAVHAQVAKLTAHYGRPLYERRGRSLHLTDVGRRVHGFAREVLERAARFERELADDGASRPASLAADASTWHYLLAPVLGRSDPAVQPVVAAGTEVLDSVARGDADLAVVTGERPDARFESALLRSVPQVLAIWGDHPLAGRDAVGIADLADVRLVAPPRGVSRRDHLEALAAAADVKLDVAVDVAGLPLALRFVEQGLGAAVVPAICTLPEGVVHVPVEGLPRILHRLVRRAGALRTRAAEQAWATLRRLSEQAP